MSGAHAAPVPAARSENRDLRHTALALLVLLAWEASGLDLVLARGFGSALGFAARDAWWSRGLLHDGGRWLSAAALLAAAVAAWCGVRNDPLHKRQRLAWLLAVGCALVLVPALKRFSATSCPWDLTLFGATVPYVSHWARALDGGPGHCFPSGHAVAAFAFFPLYFQWRPHRPVLARAILITVWGAGAMFGVAQMARGAHFASHTLWSAWLCWCIGVVAARLLDAPARDPDHGVGRGRDVRRGPNGARFALREPHAVVGLAVLVHRGGGRPAPRRPGARPARRAGLRQRRTGLPAFLRPAASIAACPLPT